MTCPVCKKENIPSLYTSCPNCATNLVSLIMVDALEEKYVETVKEKVDLEGQLIQQKKQFEQEINQKNKRIRWLGFFLLLLPFLFYWWYPSSPEVITQSIVAQSDSLPIFKQQINVKNEEIERFHRQIEAIEATQSIRELKYVIKEGDVLNDLAKLFYNDSTAWYQIALDNKIYDVRGLPIGDTLIIKYRE